MFDRKDFSERYYCNWKPTINANEIEKNNELLINYYQEYKSKLECFINELDTIQSEINKIDFERNFRQRGAYERCILRFPDIGWKEEYFQYAQAYKELMVDYLYYDDNIEYDDLSLNEIQEMKKMAYFLICQAERNIYKLMNR